MNTSATRVSEQKKLMFTSKTSGWQITWIAARALTTIPAPPLSPPGLWGAVGGFLNPHHFEPIINGSRDGAWGVDQEWLAREVWPHVRSHTLDHSSYRCGEFDAADSRGFPTPREDAHDLLGNVHGPPHYKGVTHSAVCPPGGVDAMPAGRCVRDLVCD